MKDTMLLHQHSYLSVFISCLKQIIINQLCGLSFYSFCLLVKYAEHRTHHSLRLCWSIYNSVLHIHVNTSVREKPFKQPIVKKVIKIVKLYTLFICVYLAAFLLNWLLLY